MSSSIVTIVTYFQKKKKKNKEISTNLGNILKYIIQSNFNLHHSKDSSSSKINLSV